MKKKSVTKPRSISIIVPVYNEVNTVEQLLKEVAKAKCFSLKKEIIVVDDCSSDGTKDVLQRYCKGKPVRFLSHEKNKGKGAALHTGFEAASGDIILIQDADLEYNPNEYESLLEPICAGLADVVYGSRFKGGKAHRVLFYWHTVANKFLTTISNMFTNLNLTDMETCYKVFRAEFVKPLYLQQKRFGFEPEVTAKIARMRARIFEVGISYSGRDYSEGKKIGLKDAFVAVWCVLKYNIFSRRYLRR